MTVPKNIIFVSVDDLRYDCLTPSTQREWLEKYGATSLVDTPNIADLAGRGTNFHNVTSSSSYTPPSHASIFTGLYPKNHGVKTFFNTLTQHQTLADILSSEGYDCRAWIENMALDMLDVTSGFDEVRCPFENNGLNLFDFVSEINSRKKNFLFIHLFDVHKPYLYTTGGSERYQYNKEYVEGMNSVLPDECKVGDKLIEDAEVEARKTVSNYDSLSESLQGYAKYRSLDYLLRKRLEETVGDDRFKYLVRLYVKGVSEFDQGRFVDLMTALDEELLNDYLLIFTSDHGEERCVWGKREDLMNSFNVSEGAVRVPLVVDSDIGPLQSGNERACSISQVDILPSIAEIGDLPEIGDRDGEPVLFSQDKVADTRTIFNESWYYSGGVNFFGNIDDPGDGGLSEVAVRAYPHKLVKSFSKTGNPDKALYNLEADPLEDVDISENKPNVCYELEEKITAFLEGVSMDCEPDIGGEVTEKLEERLRALGYLE